MVGNQQGILYWQLSGQHLSSRGLNYIIFAIIASEGIKGLIKPKNNGNIFWLNTSLLSTWK